ncbi:MAG: sn-glycerol-3-phosphate ABC transporter ATP-binding protein UgpC [Cellvibrionaceae bacterium]|nr:sn-glycerol-3-phosphate ABC transporter ATP-binding protein UgpC [Cellvibrionaceae bacterium]
MSKIELINIKKQYRQTEIVKGVDIQVEQGEFAVIVGPSGCGKSTLLRMIAGLEDITSGELKIGGKVVNHVSPDKRGIAMVFQSYALYPHMTVAENIGFALSLQKVNKADIAARVKEAAEMLELSPLLKRKPAELSGGQRQRVAIGRAIVKRPQLILFDEPLSNLDAKLRVQMRAELMRLHREFGSTVIYVTHDQVEAMTMAQKIIVLNQGVVAQVGKPMALYEQPANQFVAQFIGIPKMNMLAGSIKGNTFIGENQQQIPLAHNYPEHAKVHLGVRPEHLQLDRSGSGWKVFLVERLGVETFLHLRDEAEQQVVIRLEGDSPVSEDETLGLSFDAQRCFLFDANQQRLSPNIEQLKHVENRA